MEMARPAAPRAARKAQLPEVRVTGAPTDRVETGE
jgi:hypothetical protein